MQTCSHCKQVKDISEFYPNAPSNAWCKGCITRRRKKGVKIHKDLALRAEREQVAILALIKQIQTNKESYVYLLASGNRYKIGYSNNIENRVRTFNTASPIPHKIVAVAKGGKQLERELHSDLGSLRIFGEWFKKTNQVFERFKKLEDVMIFLPGYMTESAPSSPCVLG